MKFLFLYILLFLNFSVISFSGEKKLYQDRNDSTEGILEKASDYFDTGDETEALRLYLSVLEAEPENYKALWNTSFIYTRLGRQQSTYEKQKEYYEIARTFARLTLDAHQDKPRSHYVYGVSSLGLADDMPNSSERIELLHKIKEYGEKAISMDPDYAPSWHLMGLWHSNIANISRRNRLAAKLIYGSLPDGATNEKAVEHFKTAINLDPTVIIFKLDLAQHYQEQGEREKAIPLLESILKMQAVSTYNQLNMKEAKERYNQLK